MQAQRRFTRIAWAASVIGLALAAGGWFAAKTASAKEPLGRTWPADRLLSMDKIDHSGFDALLRKHVDGDGCVNYSAWRKSPADRKALAAYLDHLSQASTSAAASREAQLAFWINAYNAVTIEGILQVYPTASIRDHTSKLGGYNIWKDLPLLVGGRPYSLDAMEHQVLRRMGEPRIHFAIVCASVGCPRLRNESYTADRIEDQLADNARDFFSRPRNLRVDRDGTLHVSSILDWFGGAFGKTQAERFAYLKPYLPESARALAVNPRTRVKHLDYDWSLNDQSRKPASAGRNGGARR